MNSETAEIELKFEDMGKKVEFRMTSSRIRESQNEFVVFGKSLNELVL